MAVHGNRYFEEHTGAISFPIYQSATFSHPGLGKSTGYDYSRLQNPTREELEKTIANLEQARYGFAFSSGMAAISAILSMYSPGDHLIVSDDIYGGTYRIFEEVYRKYGIEFSYVDTSYLSLVEELIRPNTKAIFIETPTNPTMKISDIKGISELAQSKKIHTIVDNTYLTPYFQKPLTLGADIVIHSGTKYLGGHNDTLAGFVVTNSEVVCERLQFIQKSEGAVLSPFDSWLLLRGIKTLAVRMDRQQQNAFKIAQWLKQCKVVKKVYYPGLPEHEGHSLIKQQASGYGAMIAFEVDSAERVASILENIKIILFAESLGGVESLITYPMIQTHASIPEEIRERVGINDRLLRLSVGIENAEDLINDLENALNYI